MYNEQIDHNHVEAKLLALRKQQELDGDVKVKVQTKADKDTRKKKRLGRPPKAQGQKVLRRNTMQDLTDEGTDDPLNDGANGNRVRPLPPTRNSKEYDYSNPLKDFPLNEVQMERRQMQERQRRSQMMGGNDPMLYVPSRSASLARRSTRSRPSTYSRSTSTRSSPTRSYSSSRTTFSRHHRKSLNSKKKARRASQQPHPLDLSNDDKWYLKNDQNEPHPFSSLKNDQNEGDKSPENVPVLGKPVPSSQPSQETYETLAFSEKQRFEDAVLEDKRIDEQRAKSEKKKKRNRLWWMATVCCVCTFIILIAALLCFLFLYHGSNGCTKLETQCCSTEQCSQLAVCKTHPNETNFCQVGADNCNLLCGQKSDENEFSKNPDKEPKKSR